jgi:hypothetical protein
VAFSNSRSPREYEFATDTLSGFECQAKPGRYYGFLWATAITVGFHSFASSLCRRARKQPIRESYLASERQVSSPRLSLYGKFWIPVHISLDKRARRSASGHNRKLVTATRMSAIGGKAEVNFGRLHVGL